MSKHSEEQTAYDGGEDLNDGSFSKNTHKILGGAVVVLLSIGGATYATHAFMSRNAKHDVKNAEHEGLLRSRGFDENNIQIDISGHTDVITVGCPGTVLESTEEDQTRTSFNFDDETMTAYWEVAPQLDQDGQTVYTTSPIEFPLGTEVEVETFIYEDLVNTCEAIASN